MNCVVAVAVLWTKLAVSDTSCRYWSIMSAGHCSSRLHMWTSAYHFHSDWNLAITTVAQADH